MRLSDHEINSALRDRLQMPTGRHLYGVLGTYGALERYERVSFSQALGADGKPLKPPINLNRALLGRIPNDDLNQDEANLIDGVPVRDKDRPGSDRTLADWVRQCRRAGLYDQGRALYEKGGLNLDRLGETEQIEVDDDYRICVRRGGAAEAKPRRQRRKSGDQ